MGELVAELNRLAGTTGKEEAGAANAWAGTTGLETLGALNSKNGTTGVGLLGVLNALSGQTGKGANAAASGIGGVDRTQLTTGTGGIATSQATASITPSANKLILAVVSNAVATGTATLPTASGNGLTWVQVITRAFGTHRVTVFRAMGSAPTAGAVTFDFALNSQTDTQWEITEWADVDTSGTNGSGAIGATTSNAGTSTTPGAGLTPASTSAVLGAFRAASASTFTANSGWFNGFNNSLLQTVFDDTAPSTSSNASQRAGGTYAASVGWAAVIAEIKAAP